MAMIGKAVLAGVGSVTCTISSVADKELSSASMTHNAEAVPIKDGNGVVNGYIWNDDEGISLDIEYVAQASSLANAKTASGLPVPLTAVTIANFPVISIGGFTDALNTEAGTPWFYIGGGTINATGDATVPYTHKITIVKRKNITSTTAIS